MNIQKINNVTTYILIALVLAPHATKECVEICNGPIFISPAFFAMMTPFVQMDMSIHGFLIQALWAPIVVLPMFFILLLRENKKVGKYFDIYIVRWVLFAIVLIVIYNLFFWGGLRSFIFPSFIF